LKKYLLSLLISLTVVVTVKFLGCQKNQPDPLEVLARVGDQYLTRETVDSLVPPETPSENRDLVIRNLVEKWIDRQVMAQTARKE